MNHTGILRKMRAELQAPVQYQLCLGTDNLALNPYLGQRISLSHSGIIRCIACNRVTKKSFNQGYCYPCFIRLAECDSCIIKPELCHYAAGTCREPSWGESHCMQTHYVYLANSSGLKVGITRQTQIPTRWMDQGASAALPIIKVATRYLSGLVEVAFAHHVPDKTQWQQMLKGDPIAIDLTIERNRLLQLPDIQHTLADLQQRFGMNAVEVLPIQDSVTIQYPVLQYPIKVSALNFDKTPTIHGQLLGIKGQYLILDTGVLNLRKFAGYEISALSPTTV